MQDSSKQVESLYTYADVRRLACQILGELEGIALKPIERDIQVHSDSKTLALDCRIVACMNIPLLELGRRAQSMLTKAIQASTTRPLGEIRIIIDDIAPGDTRAQ